MGKLLKLLVLFTFICATGFGFYKYYHILFSRTVEGKVERVEKVSNPVAILGTNSTLGSREMFSFAIAIREKSGEIVTASSEDRQWAVVEQGKCAEAKFFPYPPWNFEKAGTYYNARLIKLHDCPTN